MRRATLTCVWALILATAGTSFAISQNSGPDGLTWFPWIITGWVLMGVWGIAAVGCGVVWLINTVRIELYRAVNMPSLDGPTVPREEMEATVRRAYWNGRRYSDERRKHATPEEIKGQAAMFTGALRDASDPTIKVEPVRRGGTTGLYAPNAPADKS